MINRQELFKTPNYLLTKYQNEIFRQLDAYMRQHGLSQKEIAEKLGVSNAYVSQILNGNFNFTLKKLIEIGLMMGRVPSIEFLTKDDFEQKEKKKTLAVKASRPTKGNVKFLSPIKKKVGVS
jgi:transcriptional regulator with XRE-family HTH domain